MSLSEVEARASMANAASRAARAVAAGLQSRISEVATTTAGDDDNELPEHAEETTSEDKDEVEKKLDVEMKGMSDSLSTIANMLGFCTTWSNHYTLKGEVSRLVYPSFALTFISRLNIIFLPRPLSCSYSPHYLFSVVAHALLMFPFPSCSPMLRHPRFL